MTGITDPGFRRPRTVLHTADVLQVTVDLHRVREVPVSEAIATFEDIVGPLRAEFAVCPLTGQLAARRSGRLARLLRGLAVLGCVQGHALVTPAVTGIHAVDDRSQER